MEKGEIIAENGLGSYSVKIIYGYRDKVEQRIGNMENQIILLNQKIALAEEGLEKQVMELQVKALEKQIWYLGIAMPADPTRDLWCSDFTTGLTGDVGLIEIPDEIAEKISTLNSLSTQTTPKYTKINIRPGFIDQAVYSYSRDGEIVPVVAMSAAQMFWNKSALPGVQKWRPRFRYGVIVADSIDFQANTCSVCLDPEYSSQQNLVINQGDTFSDCTGLRPSGFDQFCADNPTHPTCVNTEEGGGYWISDETLASIKAVNESVNQDHEYQTDKSGYGIGENWVEMAPGQKGDCEDFALTKQKALYDLGIPIQHLQLAIGETETGGWHAFLMIRSGNRGSIILDNRFDNVMNINNVPYRFKSYQKSGSVWNGYGVRLTDVPIEYMSCNAAAFADNDEIVVEFTGQNFASPKVVGFKKNPKPCSFAYRIFLNSFFPRAGYGRGLIYDPVGNAYATTATFFHLNNIAIYTGGFASADHQTCHVLGGGTAGDYKDTNSEYTPDLDSWAAKATMVGVRTVLKGLMAGGFGFAIGGWDGTLPLTTMGRVEKYNFSADTWATVNSIGPGRWAFATWSINQKGYVICGQQDGDSLLNGIHEYDVSSGTWALKASPTARAGHSGFETESYGYFTAGVTYDDPDGKDQVWFNDADTHFSARHYQYNPMTLAITRKMDLTTTDPVQAPTTGIGAAGAIGKGNCLDGSYSNEARNYEYDEVADVWTEKALLPIVNIYDERASVYSGVAVSIL